MSTAILVCALGSSPCQTVIDGKEFLEAHATASTPEPLSVVLRARATTHNTGATSRFRAKKAGDLVIVSGELSLGAKDTEIDGSPIITMSTICDAEKDQFFNEAVVVGRFSRDGKPAEKSSSRSVAVNRYLGKTQLTDWFRVRGYGFWKDKILETPKGSIVEITGMLTPAKSSNNKSYTELKCRSIRVHEKGGGGAGADPAKDKAAAGYEHSEFMGQDEAESMPPQQNWS